MELPLESVARFLSFSTTSFNVALIKFEQVISIINFRNITIVDPKFSYGQGVIIGSEVQRYLKHILFIFGNISQDLPMKNIVFDGVRVLQAANSDLEKYHTCKGEAKLTLCWMR